MTQWGELELFFKARIISDLGNKWKNHLFLKHFKHIYEERIMHAHLEKRQKDLTEKGYTLIGDVHPHVIDKAEYLTPVPGGVGPLTVAMLMRNTLEAFKQRRNIS